MKRVLLQNELYADRYSVCFALSVSCLRRRFGEFMQIERKAYRRAQRCQHNADVTTLVSDIVQNILMRGKRLKTFIFFEFFRGKCFAWISLSKYYYITNLGNMCMAEIIVTICYTSTG